MKTQDMHTWFKFPLEGVTMMPPKYQATPFWNAITGSGRFYPKNSSNRLIKDNCLMLFHKFLSHALFGRVESSKVQLKDVFVLSLLQENKTPCSISSIFEGLFAASKSKQKTVGMGHMITGIILGCLGQLRGFEPNEGEQIQYLNEGLLKNAHLVSTTNGGLKFVSYEARTAKFLAGKDKGKATVTNQDVSEEEDEEEDDEAMNMDAPITEIIGKGKRKADVTNQHVSEEKNEEEDDEAANMDAPITEIIGKGKRKADVTNQDMSEEKDEDDDDEAAVMDAPTTEIEGWKQVLQRLDIMDRNHQNLVGQLGRIEHEVKKMRREHKSLTRNVMSYQNMEFSLTPPGSPSNDT
ncbi:uncharacterized protein [Euphorbia lathyris]|uniref:uncharacterized protein isoform X2 n=1 Tax=Euphorbia lathyris TaxID=212925 RepID=UPI0033141A98